MSRIKKDEELLEKFERIISLSELLSECYGPSGNLVAIDKRDGELIFTSDGMKILESLKDSDPLFGFMFGAAKAMDEYVGDYTKTTIILIGQLLKNSLELENAGLAPQTIIDGYSMAMDRVARCLRSLVVKLSFDGENLAKISRTIIQSRGVMGKDANLLANLSSQAVLKIVEEIDGKKVAKEENIKISSYDSGELHKSRLISGVVSKPAYGEEKLNPVSPRIVENARIAFINSPIEVVKPKTKHRILVKDPSHFLTLSLDEIESVNRIVSRLKEIGANAVISSRRIDALPVYLLGINNIMAVRNVPAEDLERMARATGGKISAVSELSEDDLGECERVEWKRLIPDGEPHLFLEGCPKRSVSLLILGASIQIEEAVNDAVKNLCLVTNDGMRVVPGGLASEIEILMDLKKFSRKAEGKKSMAIEAFAKSVEFLIDSLLKNSVSDTESIKARLISRHVKGEKFIGFDCEKEKIADTKREGILEPFKAKLLSFITAYETARTLLRIDKILNKK